MESPGDRAALTLELLRETAGLLGVAFAERLVECLSARLGALLVSAGRLDPRNPELVVPAAMARDGKRVEPQPYHLAGTPCAVVVERGPQQIPDRVAERFPEDHILEELGARCYIGQPIRSASGETIGVLAALFDHPHDLAVDENIVLEVCAARLGAEFEREDSQRALHRALRHESVARVTGQVAHDFNNLLTAIQGNLELLEDPLEPSEQAEILTEIREAVTTMADRTAGLLAASGRRPATTEAIELGDLVSRTLDSLRPRLADRDVSVSLRRDPGPMIVLGDGRRLRRLLVSLLEERLALRRTDGQERSVAVRLERRLLTSTESVVRLGLVIEGAPAADRSESGSEGPLTSGLDRTVEDAIVAEHHARFVDRDGDALCLEFPLTDAPLAAPRIPRSLGQAGGSPQSLGGPAPVPSPAHRRATPSPDGRTEPPSARDGASVLVADGDDLVRRACIRSLGPLGTATLEAHSAERLLELLEESALPPAVVLLDIHLPGLPLQALVRRIRSRSASGPRVLLMSSVGSPELPPEDALPIIPKPFSAQALRDEVTRALRGPAVSPQRHPGTAADGHQLAD